MAVVVVTQGIEGPLSALWASWDAFADIQEFHPDISKSYLLDQSAPTGIGARRQCDFSDGKTYLREEIIGYSPERQLVFDIFESSVPLKTAVVTLDFEAEGENRSKVRMEVEFMPKLGLIGRLLTPLIKKQFSKGLTRLLAGNASYVEHQLKLRAAAE